MGSNGAQLAVDYFNEKGGIQSLGGAQIQMELYDTTSEVDQSRAVLERALAGEGVVAAIGCGTSAITLPAIRQRRERRFRLSHIPTRRNLPTRVISLFFPYLRRRSMLAPPCRLS